MEQSCERDAAGTVWFHISTKGIDKSLFKASEDFQKALNIIAVCAIAHEVTLHSYCLMTNHIHLAGRAVSDEVLLKFINSVKQNYSRYFRKVHGEDKIFGRVPVSINKLKTRQDLRNCIAYILRNPVEAKMCSNADQYPWSSYRCYFRPENASDIATGASSFSGRELNCLLKTRIDISSSGLSISDDGNILPETFVESTFVEELFHNSRDELAKYIAVNPYLALEYEWVCPKSTGLPHFELVKIASELAEGRFGKKLSLLNMNERSLLALVLNSDYHAGPYIICQVLSLSRKTVHQILGLPQP